MDEVQEQASGEEYGTSELSRNGMTFTVGSTGTIASTDPWASAAEKCPVGTMLHGKIVNFKPYGFFVETNDGFFGLVHMSQITGWSGHHRFDEIFRMGEEVDVRVTNLDVEGHRMAFAYDMPEDKENAAEQAIANASPAAVQTAGYSDAAKKWIETNPVKSAAAKAWLEEELQTGPIYGPLASVLSDRFDVPVPVSFWIRQFPEFLCYSGRGDNPRDLPAVALATKAPLPAYWDLFKAKVGDLQTFKTAEAEAAAKYGPIAAKIAELKSFPSSAWVAAYQDAVATIAARRDDVGRGDVLERLVVPLMAEMGWSETAGTCRLTRGDRGDFSLRIADGEKLRVALVCGRAGEDFWAQRNGVGDAQSLEQRNIIERMLGYANRQKDLVEGATKVVWTDGLKWVILSDDLIARRIGILSDRTGEQILDASPENATNVNLSVLTLPKSADALTWLGSFATLCGVLGRKNS